MDTPITSLHTVDGRNPANHLRGKFIPLFTVFFYIPGGERRISEPSTVVHGFLWQLLGMESVELEVIAAETGSGKSLALGAWSPTW